MIQDGRGSRRDDSFALCGLASPDPSAQPEACLGIVELLNAQAYGRIVIQRILAFDPRLPQPRSARLFSPLSLGMFGSDATADA